MDNNRNILFEAADPRGKTIILYSDTWHTHIIENHPEMEDKVDIVKKTIEDPDFIREGRTSDSELYVRVESVSGLQFTGILTATRDTSETTIITTAFEGNDTHSKGKTIWSKTRGDHK